MVAELITSYDWQSANIESLKVLDLACGDGHNGLWFAQQGAQVHFIDRDLSRLQCSRQQYPDSSFSERDMELANSPRLEVEGYDVILVFNYLHRPLLTQLKVALKPSGILFYETFTTAQAAIGRPKNPNFLLNENELKEAFSPWPAIHYEEGLLKNGLTGKESYKARMICQKS